jgi:hypothetical protein
MLERVDDVCTNAEQAEFEDLKQPARASTNDYDIRLNCTLDRAACYLAQKLILTRTRPGWPRGWAF